MLEATEAQLRRYFAGEQLEFDLPLAPVGSPFQQQGVGGVAAHPGRRDALLRANRGGGRPPGRAAGRRPGQRLQHALAIVIPCHRVIGSDGSLSGYGGGVWRKQRLLDHERAEYGAVRPA